MDLESLNQISRGLIGPDHGACTAQLCVRAVFLLLFGLVCIRLAGRRTFSHMTPLDIIVALIVGSNISRVMTGGVEVWPALGATLVLVCLHRALAMLSLRWSPLAHVLKAGPVLLVRNGRVDHKAMARHAIGGGDLAEALRMEQVESLDGVETATLEAGGKISVVRKPSS